MDTLANSEDPGEMQHNAAFHLGLHCLLRLKQPSGTELNVHHNLQNSTCDPLIYKIGNTILIVSIRMEKSIRLQRVNVHLSKSSRCKSNSFDPKNRSVRSHKYIFSHQNYRHMNHYHKH